MRRLWKRTNVLIARAQHNSFVDAENVSTLESVGPATAGQVTQHRRLAVRLIRVGLRAVARIESNLGSHREYVSVKSEANPLAPHTLACATYRRWYAVRPLAKRAGQLSTRRGACIAYIEYLQKPERHPRLRLCHHQPRCAPTN